MTDSSLHFFCGLHAKWNVRDHVCSNGGVFGKRQAEMWSRRMQNAEGPQAFEVGYRKMMDDLRDDIPRSLYIDELYRDEKKAYFKQSLQFSNAVLVDVCEILFSATKTWVMGSSRRGVSLLLAVVRIVEGCRDLLLKPFLKSMTTTKRFITKKTKNTPVLGKERKKQ